MHHRDIDVVRKALTPGILETGLKPDDFLRSGSLLLDLACSGSPLGAFSKGKYFWMVGDSSSGKTFLTLTALAEASINPNFNDYDLIFDNAEDGALMNVERYFGPRLAQRLQAPRYTKEGAPIYSEFTEDFYYHLDDCLTKVESGKARPFVYLLDSMDALDTRYAQKKFKERKTADRSGKKAKGEWGDGKAKINSQWVRGIVARVRKTRSILIILSQTRDKLSTMPVFGDGKTFSGGHSLKFYATCQIWSSVLARKYKTVNGKKRQIGIVSRISVKKNRMTGKEWSVDVPIYWSSGIDDVGGCVDFLLDESYWKVDGTKISAKDLDFEGTRGELISKIEDENLELELQQIVVERWRAIEEACAVPRKNKYH